LIKNASCDPSLFKFIANSKTYGFLLVDKYDDLSSGPVVETSVWTILADESVAIDSWLLIGPTGVECNDTSLADSWAN